MSSISRNQASGLNGAYRDDIDGLRAIAVLSVVLFHCEVEALSGGYVGVDVFFVISGFLITRNILTDAQAGVFSFRTFYLRRSRRLIPALIATLAATLVAGAVVMSPPDLAATARSALFAALSLSNFHFAAAASYFGPASDLKPVLHTWSLSVEEQFYLLWPAVLALVFRLGGMRAAFWLVVASIPLGLAVSELWIHLQPRQAYFLTPFRAFQFMLGAACVWLLQRRIRSAAGEAAVFLIGLALTLGPMVLYDAETPFPGVHALIPALGAMLLIWTGAAARVTVLLANAPMIWIGRISYSVYLAHWPIIVFYRYVVGHRFDIAEQAMLAAASVLAGWALFIAVEQRFRIKDPARAARGAAAGRPSLRPLAMIGASILAVAATALAVHRAEGLPQRLAARPALEAFRNDTAFAFLRDHGDGALRLGRAENGRRILIVGDSMMQNYIPALLTLPEIAAAHVDVVTRGGCFMGAGLTLVNFGSPDRGCAALRDQALALPDDYDLVIWTQNWRGYGETLTLDGQGRALALADGRWDAALAAAAPAWARKGRRLVVFGPQLRIEGVSPLIERIGPLFDLERIPAALGDMREADPSGRERLAEAVTAALRAAAPDAIVIDPRAMLCGNETCALHDGARPYYFDATHHTALATGMLARRLAWALAPEIAALGD